jgi:hypothetical protein
MREIRTLTFAISWVILAGFPAAADPVKFRIDAAFLYDARVSAERIELTGMSFDDLNSRGRIDPADYNRLTNVFQAAFGWGTPAEYAPDPSIAPARNLDESLALMRNVAPSLSRDLRLGLLSAIVNEALKGYDPTQTGARTIPMESIFQNARMSERAGGACGNIHAFGALYAEALGFVEVGSQTALQADGDGQEAIGHVVLHYRDPETGEYFLQNYHRIIATGQTTLPAFLEFADRLAGAFETTIQTEHHRADGDIRVHVFQPRVSRWIQGLLEEASSIEESDSELMLSLKIQAGNREQLVRLSFQEKKGPYSTRLFALHDQYRSDTGPVRYAAAGIALGFERESAKRGISARALGGIQHLTTPTIDPAAQARELSRRSLVGAFDVRAFSRQGRFTGALEAKALSTDYAAARGTGFGVGLSAPAHDFSASGKLDLAGGISLEASRHWEIAADSLQSQRPRVGTAFDAFDVLVDTRGDRHRAYVRSSTRLFVFEGFENLSAVAIKQVVEAVFPSARFGQFAVVGDGSRFVGNRSQDPFYASPAWGESRLSWEKGFLSDHLKAGASGTLAAPGNPFFRFQDPSRTTPDIGGDPSHGRRLLFWLQTRWGRR